MVRVPITGETEIEHQAHGAFSWRWTYRRAADSQASGAIGQDYLTYRYGEGAFTFALCDGVGQSYFGDLAAGLLGDALTEWLWSSLAQRPAEHLELDALTETVKQEAARFLATLTVSGTQRVEAHQLPADLQPMLQTVLEQKRAEGSATTFVAGHLDAPSARLPNGRIVLLWTGDSRVRLWNGDGELTGDLHDTFVTGAGWSTRVGLVGDGPHVLIARLDDPLTHLSAYSDGLATLNDWTRPLLDAELSQTIDEAQHSPTSDDIALLDVWLRPRNAPKQRSSATATPRDTSTAGDSVRRAPETATMQEDYLDDEQSEDSTPTIKMRRPRQFTLDPDGGSPDQELASEDVADSAPDPAPNRAADRFTFTTSMPDADAAPNRTPASAREGRRQSAPRSTSRSRRRAGGPSLRLAIVVLAVGILFGLLVGLAAWMFGFRAP